jgi:hypothetical protein
MGIYSNGDCDTLIPILEHVHAISGLNTSIPTLFAFENDSHLPIFDTVSIFPAFSTNGSYPWRAIKDSFDSMVNKNFIIETEFVDSIRIYLRDSTDMYSIRRLVEDTIRIFPEICHTTLLFQCPARMASPKSTAECKLIFDGFF